MKKTKKVIKTIIIVMASLVGAIVLAIGALVLIEQLYPIVGRGNTVISISLDNASDILMDGNNLVSFTVKDSADNSVRINCSNVTVASQNRIAINEGGYLYIADCINGINYVDISKMYGEEYDSSISYYGGYGPDGEYCDDYKDIIWGRGSSVWTDENLGRFRSKLITNHYAIKADRGTSYIEELIVRYSPNKTVKPFSNVEFDEGFYQAYTEGDLYDSLRERWDPENGILSFYIVMTPAESKLEKDTITGTYCFEVCDLYDKNGNVKDKHTAGLEEGDSISVLLAGNEYKVNIPVFSSFQANNLKELLPFVNYSAIGDLNAIVVPVCFEDQWESISDERSENIKKALGRVSDGNGVKTYSLGDKEEYSLSDYFDAVSYGKEKITSFVTDWYVIKGKKFFDYIDLAPSDKQIDEICKWVNANYPNLGPEYDLDNNGYYDAVIFVFAASERVDSYLPNSYGGANHRVSVYGSELQKKGERAINQYVIINEAFLFPDEFEPLIFADTNVLIHEVSHGFGLIDYYDVNYSGIDAVGKFDMQSANVGDWNAYSKFAAGWIEPKVITPDMIEADNSIDVNLESFAKTGDCVIIPTKSSILPDGSVSPFSEYILIDYFTPDGVNKKDSQMYDISDVRGVRIYHIDARMIRRDFLDSVHKNNYSLGTEVYVNSYNEAGKYQVELIQKPGINTFTDLNNLQSIICEDDFFYTGDSFGMDTHNSFFVDGRMDDGSELNYEIDILSTGGDNASIRIKRK